MDLRSIVIISVFLLPPVCATTCGKAEKAGYNGKDTVLPKIHTPRMTPDTEILNRFFLWAGKHQPDTLTVPDRITAIASFFLGTPYTGGTLDVNEREQLVVNLREMDCVTFVEYVLALSLIPTYNDEAASCFLRNLRLLRYRNGEITDYTSRLHYSTDWLFEMQRQGIVTDITQRAGGEVYSTQINYISTHPAAYRALTRDSLLIPRIKEIEAEINDRTMYYIPKERVKQLDDRINNGDIILITTSVDGLDTAHLGIALKKEGRIHLIHASSSAAKVVISDTPLSDYLNRIRSFSGIIIGRTARN